ncbi:MAG: hypothetical protein JXB08_05060 [Bacilli bacterium]|nr:hypothetical protein [Bacilli bacterium]MBN2877450.1 hypothetical protein [Bacilli bacterium]
MEAINYEKVKEELQQKNLYDIQKELTLQRKIRTGVMSLLLFALMFTLVFGMLEDPIIYTLSNIGNFFTYRIIFIVWAIIAGTSIEVAVLSLFRLEAYKSKYGRIFIYLAVLFLIATAIIPALKDDYPILHVIHTITSGLLALFLYLGLVPFARWISKENPRLQVVIAIWLGIIWIGSVLMIVLFWHSAMFELWFFVSNIAFLLYLSLVLFEEKIVKTSVKLLMDEENLNLAIEKIFVNLDDEKKKKSK